MAGWLAEREAPGLPRDADSVAAAQGGYWERIAAHGAETLDGFARAGRFGPPGRPAEELIGDPKGVVPA
jgi:hypothetical protein